MLKNTLAALFVGEVVYVAATLIFLFGVTGISSRKTTGLGAVWVVASSPVVLLIGAAGFLGALVLFSRT